MKLGAGFVGEFFGARRIFIGNREKFDGGVVGRQRRPQRADAAAADHGDAELLAFDDVLPVLIGA